MEKIPYKLYSCGCNRYSFQKSHYFRKKKLVKHIFYIQIIFHIIIVFWKLKVQKCKKDYVRSQIARRWE